MALSALSLLEPGSRIGTVIQLHSLCAYLALMGHVAFTFTSVTYISVPSLPLLIDLSVNIILNMEDTNAVLASDTPYLFIIFSCKCNSPKAATTLKEKKYIYLFICLRRFRVAKYF